MSKSQGGASVSPYTSLPSPLKVGIITESEKYKDKERKMEGRKELGEWKDEYNKRENEGKTGSRKERRKGRKNDQRKKVQSYITIESKLLIKISFAV